MRDTVPVYGSGGFTSYDDRQLATQLRDFVDTQGIPRVKIKIGESGGHGVERDLSRIAQARALVGDGTELYVDANGGYTARQAVRVAHRMARYDVTWFEEPVSSDDLHGLRAVRDAVEPDVAAGEYGWDLPYFHRMCRVAHCAPHLHLDAALATANLRHVEWFHDHVRIESTLFDGAVDAKGGAMRPDLTVPGHGLTFKAADAQPYRVG